MGGAGSTPAAVPMTMMTTTTLRPGDRVTIPSRPTWGPYTVLRVAPEPGLDGRHWVLLGTTSDPATFVGLPSDAFHWELGGLALTS